MVPPGRHIIHWVAGVWLLAMFWPEAALGRTLEAKQRSLEEWRLLTTATKRPPRVFVKSRNLRLFFESPGGVTEFKGDWERLRVPTPGYRVNSARLHYKENPDPLPEADSGWREARVIGGTEWQELSRDLIEALAPAEPGRGYYYQAFLAEGLIYRDAAGHPRRAPEEPRPAGIILDRRFSIEETLEVLAGSVSAQLEQSYPGEKLFLVMPPSTSNRVAQPLLLDNESRQCVWLLPAALYQTREGGYDWGATAQGLASVVFESHGLALLKNPVSSAFRLGDLGWQTAIRFLRQPLPRGRPELPPAGQKPGMDLARWEKWLDVYTGTRRVGGSMNLQIGGARFYSRLEQGIREATNHIHFNVYIFDRDDVAVGIADALKARSAEARVRVIMDSMGTMSSGLGPPGTPMPTDFVPPAGRMGAYLERDSEVKARWFFNPWFSSDHSKVYLIDGVRGWVGGMNIGREYRYEWHDLMVELEGPVVWKLEEEFRAMWAHAGSLGDISYAATSLGQMERPPPESWTNSTQLRLLPTKTAWKPFATAVLASLRQAKNHVYVEHPYLFDKRVLIGLVQARKRGVDVRVVLPRVNDLRAGERSNLVTANYLIRNGVRVYFYPGMTHVKALLVDDWVCLGSANLNHMSMRLCQEQNVASSDPVVTGQVKRELFEEDFRRSHELTEALSVGWVDFLADLVLESF